MILFKVSLFSCSKLAVLLCNTDMRLLRRFEEKKTSLFLSALLPVDRKQTQEQSTCASTCSSGLCKCGRPPTLIYLCQSSLDSIEEMYSFSGNVKTFCML